MKIRVRLSNNLCEINKRKAKNICAQLKDDEAMLYVNPKTKVARLIEKNVIAGYKILCSNQTAKLFQVINDTEVCQSLKREKEVVRALFGLAKDTNLFNS